MKRALFLMILSCLVVIAPFVSAQETKQSPTGSSKAGMDPERLARITARMKEFVEKGTIAGAVTLVARHGVVAHLEAVGYQDLETKKPMRTDTIFNIASMTKSLTAVGIMILLEEGRLTLTDPVEKHLPGFRDQMMVDRREGDKVLTLKKPSRPITIRDLLTHTSGMPGDDKPRPKELTDLFSKTSFPELAEVVAIRSREPLEFEPGTKYHYSSRGFGTLEFIIESITGQAYEEFIEQRITRPLGMKDTFYFPPPEKCDRVASVYDLEDGRLKKRQIDLCRKKGKSDGPLVRVWFSTASDIFAFYQMMLNGGTYNGVRILSRASVEAMTTDHIGDLSAFGSAPTLSGPSARPEFGRGLGWIVIRDLLDRYALALQSIGSYGHSGASGTYGWVDPEKDLVGVFLIQLRFRRGARAADRPERLAFIAMAAAAIVDRSSATSTALPRYVPNVPKPLFHKLSKE